VPLMVGFGLFVATAMALLAWRFRPPVRRLGESTTRVQVPAGRSKISG